MMEFFTAAFPWIIMGLCLGGVCVYFANKKEK